MNELVKLEEVTALSVFGESGNVDPLIEKIKKAALAIVPDMSSEKGRAEIRTLAMNVSKSKTFLDNLGKDLVSGWKKQAKVVDADRKKLRDELDDLKKEVRQPLTDFEDKEKNRVAYLQACVSAIENYQYLTQEIGTPEELQSKLNELNAIVIDDTYEEFMANATSFKANSVRVLEFAVNKLVKEESDKAELEKLRKEKEAREKADYEENLKKEAAEKATREAEEKAEKERKRVEAEKVASEKAQQEKDRLAKEALEKAEQDKKDAELAVETEKKNAKAKADLAAKQEREKIEVENKQKKEAEEARAADEKHRAKINNAVLDLLVEQGYTNRIIGKQLITSMAKNKIPHVKIMY